MSLFTKESINNYFNNVINIVRNLNNDNLDDTIKILKSFFKLLFKEDMIVESHLKDINIKNPIKLVTFDLDGTLWDCNVILLPAKHELFYYLIKNYPKIQNFYSTSEVYEKGMLEYRKTDPIKLTQFLILRREFTKHVLIQAGYENLITDETMNNIMNVYITARHKISQYNPMVFETFSILKYMNIQIGAITNGTTDINKIPELNKVMMFDVKCEEINSSKPDVKMFELAMKKADVKNSKLCIHIGDCFEEDIVGAINSGFHSIWIENFDISPSLDEGTVVIPSFLYVLPSILYIMFNN